jgi:hypothetical protein
MSLEYAVQGRRNAAGILTQVAEVRTYKRQLSFGGVNLLDAADPLYSFLLKDIAAKAVYGVRRIDDNPSFCQTVHDSVDLPLRGMFRMDMEPHGLKVPRTTASTHIQLKNISRHYRNIISDSQHLTAHEENRPFFCGKML